MTNEMEKVEIEIERLRKDRTFLLQVCKFCLLMAESGRDVKGALREAVNQIELSGRLA